MDKITSEGFGLSIAFLSPGALVLVGIARHIGSIEEWMVGTRGQLTATGVLLVLLGASALGVFISGIRWLLVDKGLFTMIGPKRPSIDDTKFADPDALRAYQAANEWFYRYYQFYSNMAVAVLVSLFLWMPEWTSNGCFVGGVGIVMVILLLASARNSLETFYGILEAVMGRRGND